MHYFEIVTVELTPNGLQEVEVVDARKLQTDAAVLVTRKNADARAWGNLRYIYRSVRA